MSAQSSSFTGEDQRTWQDRFEADAATLTARAWNSDLLAAFHAARAYYARTYGDKLREAYGHEWLKVLTQAFEVYAALINAAEEDEDEARRKSAVRRFPLPAWRAQQFLSCKFIPYIADEREFKKLKATLTRGWSRYGWRWVHKFQCVTDDELFKCETLEFRDNTDGAPAHYTDNLCDLLTATIRLARRGRSRARRVNRFAEAFAEALRERRRDGRVPKFAELWGPPPVIDEAARHAARVLALYRVAPALVCLAAVAVEEAERPATRAREVMRAAVKRALALLTDCPETERAAFQMEAHALIDEACEGEDETPAAPCPPCV